MMTHVQKVVTAALLAFLPVLALAHPAQARTQTYQAHCIPSPQGEVTGNLYGFVTTTDGGVYLVNLWCHSGQNGDLSIDPRPVIPSTAGAVTGMYLVNRVYLRLPTGQKVRVHTGGSSNGWFSKTDFYDAANKEGEVIFSIDISNN